MIKLEIWKWGEYPGLSGCAQCHHMGPYMEKKEATESESEEM